MSDVAHSEPTTSRVAITTNNITYAAFGEAMQY